jgi:prepilin-type N-terminal cleavage/methylation domain-containing protein
MQTQDKDKKRGFTLIELLVVVSIISLLSSVVIASLAEARERARWAAFDEELRQIVTAINLHRTDTGQWPTSLYNTGRGGVITSLKVDSSAGDLVAELYSDGYYGKPILPESPLPAGGDWGVYPGARLTPDFDLSCGQYPSDEYLSIYHGESDNEEWRNSNILSDIYFGGPTGLVGTHGCVEIK